jgi:hypothetical protein
MKDHEQKHRLDNGIITKNNYLYVPSLELYEAWHSVCDRKLRDNEWTGAGWYTISAPDDGWDYLQSLQNVICDKEKSIELLRNEIKELNEFLAQNPNPKG